MNELVHHTPQVEHISDLTRRYLPFVANSSLDKLLTVHGHSNFIFMNSKLPRFGLSGSELLESIFVFEINNLVLGCSYLNFSSVEFKQTFFAPMIHCILKQHLKIIH